VEEQERFACLCVFLGGPLSFLCLLAAQQDARQQEQEISRRKTMNGGEMEQNGCDLQPLPCVCDHAEDSFTSTALDMNRLWLWTLIRF